MRRTVDIPGFGKITAEDSTLSIISLWAAMADEKWTQDGAHGIAKEANEASLTIYNFLNEKGYYKKAE